MFANYQVFLLKAAALGLATVLTIPRRDYPRLFSYGLVFGIGEIITVLILTLLGLVKYTNMGPYNILDLISFWTPLAWVFAFMLFFRFLPLRMVLFYPYLIAWAWLSYTLGLMLENFGVFRYQGFWRFFAPFTFLAWYAASAWLYLRAERMELK